MPKIAAALSAAQVAKLSEAGLYAVGGVAGLQLRIDPGGSRHWILRVKVGTKRRDIGLGGFPTVTLAQARERAREARELIWRGIDPVEQRKAARAALVAAQDVPTFAECARRFLANKRAEFRNAKHAAQWAATLETYAGPIIGNMPVDQVELRHIESILSPIWMSKTETAKRLRGRIEAVLDWATVSGHREGLNPARWKGHLDAVLASPNKVAKKQHFAAMPYTDVPAFLVELRQREGIAARALEFTVLTAARSGEARGATWKEIDMDAGIWTIPADRMKAGKEHRVPLTDAAIAILRELPRLDDSPDSPVFFAPRGGQLSDMALTSVLRRMGKDVTTHGFRSSFRDWAADQTSFPREVAEQALAHTLQGVEAAYRRSDLFEKRRKLMDAWASHCAPGDAKVTPIKRQAKA